MRSRGGRAALLVVTALVLAGCGDRGGGDGAAAQLAQAKTYASGVSAITQRTSTRLAAIADRAEYRDGDAAAASTREYAGVIRTAATELERITPPSAAARDHQALVALYRATASQMDGLADGFATARGDRALTAKAQELSAEVQRYSTQELALRTAIERALPAATSPGTAPAPDGTATGPAGEGDPG